MGSRIRELELQVAYLRGYSKISESDFEIACERYGMGKVNQMQVRITNDEEGWELISDLEAFNSPGAIKALLRQM